jgi:hypothetical protein
METPLRRWCSPTASCPDMRAAHKCAMTASCLTAGTTPVCEFRQIEFCMPSTTTLTLIQPVSLRRKRSESIQRPWDRCASAEQIFCFRSEPTYSTRSGKIHSENGTQPSVQESMRRSTTRPNTRILPLSIIQGIAGSHPPASYTPGLNSALPFSSKVRAVCTSSARTDLRGGRAARLVPTATKAAKLPRSYCTTGKLMKLAVPGLLQMR